MNLTKSTTPKPSIILGQTSDPPPRSAGSAAAPTGFVGRSQRFGRRSTLLALAVIVVVATLFVALVVVTFGTDDPEESALQTGGADRVVAGAPEQSALPAQIASLDPLRVEGVPLESYGSDLTLSSSVPETTDGEPSGSPSSSSSQTSAARSTSTSGSSSTLGGITEGSTASTRGPSAGSDTTAGSAPSTTARPTTVRSTAKPATTLKSTTVKPATTVKPTTVKPAITVKPATTVKPTTVKPTTTTTTTTRPTTSTTAGSSGKVIWEEHFNSLDLSKWKLEHSTYGDGNNELQCYRPENVSVANGKLTLRAVTETYTCPSGSTRQVTSGMIRSRGVTFSPGQAIEFRVKLNPADPSDQSGLWPAVWSSGWAGGGWPTGGELDYLEVMTAEDPNRAMFSMHYRNSSGSHELQNKGIVGSEYFSNSWHTIRFEYGRGGNLAWYLDGVEAFRVTGAATLQGFPAPFDQGIGEIKINLALGGRPGPLSNSAVGSEGASFEMDFIRILEL